MKKLEQEAKRKHTQKKARQEFIKFSKELWISEITNDDIGSNIYQKTRQVCEVQKLYEDIKNKFDIVYKERNIEKVNLDKLEFKKSITQEEFKQMPLEYQRNWCGIKCGI